MEPRRAREPIGPERPTFVERAIAAIPLPYALSCLLIAVLTQAPGRFLAYLLDSGSLDAAWQQAFVGDPPAPVDLVVFGLTFSIAFYSLMLYLVRVSRQGLESARKDIVPLLPDGEAGFRRIYGLLHARIPVLLLAAALGGFFLVASGASLNPAPALVVFIAVVAQLAVITLSIATVLWTFFVTLWGLRRLGREPLLLKPYYEDPMRGLRPLGQMSLSATMVYFGAIAITLIPTLFFPQSLAQLALPLLLIVLGAVLFVLPLLGIHRTMAEDKKRLLRSLSDQAATRFRPATPSSPSPEATLIELRTAVLELRDAVALERAQRQVAVLPTWPFEPEVTGRIAAITLTGVIAVVGRAAVDFFLVGR